MIFGLLVVTYHFIIPDFKMKEITLAIQYMPYPHTGEVSYSTSVKENYFSMGIAE